MYKSNKAKLITTHMQIKRSYSASVLSNKHNNATGFSADNAGDYEELMLRKTGNLLSYGRTFYSRQEHNAFRNTIKSPNR